MSESEEIAPEESAKKPKSLFKKTKVAGLIIYLPTGTYYAYFKAGGKIIKQSLETCRWAVMQIHRATSAVHLAKE